MKSWQKLLPKFSKFSITFPKFIFIFLKTPPKYSQILVIQNFHQICISDSLLCRYLLIKLIVSRIFTECIKMFPYKFIEILFQCPRNFFWIFLKLYSEFHLVFFKIFQNFASVFQEFPSCLSENTLKFSWMFH